MQTIEIISTIQQDYPDIQVPTVVRHLNEVNRIMLSKPTAFMRILDPTTGLDPKYDFDGTSALYDIDTASGFPEDALIVEKVYSFSIDDNIDVDTREATLTTPAQVAMGGCTGNYSVRAYRKPNIILSANMNLEIPERYHYTIVIPGIQGLIEISEFGESRKWELFEKKLLPKFWMEQSVSDTFKENRMKKYE